MLTVFGRHDGEYCGVGAVTQVIEGSNLDLVLKEVVFHPYQSHIAVDVSIHDVLLTRQIVQVSHVF